MEGSLMNAAPVMPNASLVVGTVQDLKSPEHGQEFPVLALLVDEAENVADLANFCAEEVGNVIPVILQGPVHDKLLRPKAKVHLRVEFRGDEWGGGYYANTEDLKLAGDRSM